MEKRNLSVCIEHEFCWALYIYIITGYFAFVLVLSHIEYPHENALFIELSSCVSLKFITTSI